MYNTSMICTDALHCLHSRACFPDGACGVLGQHFGAKVAEFGISRIGELTMTRSRVRRATSTAAGIVHRCIPWCAPWIKPCPVLGGESSDVAVQGSVLRICDCRFHAAATTVYSIGVGTAVEASTITLLATNRAPDGHPQTGLSGIAHVGAVPASARDIAMWVPNVGGFPAMPLWEFAVNSVPRFGLDKTAVSCDGRNIEDQEYGGPSHAE